MPAVRSPTQLPDALTHLITSYLHHTRELSQFDSPASAQRQDKLQTNVPATCPPRGGTRAARSLPFLRAGADDEDDLIQDAIAALPPLVARFFFAPRGGPKAPPLLGRCFTLKKLSAPHDMREALLRGAANSFRFSAEYRWSACAVGFVAGFADGSAWSASWLVATSARLYFWRLY